MRTASEKPMNYQIALCCKKKTNISDWPQIEIRFGIALALFLKFLLCRRFARFPRRKIQSVTSHPASFQKSLRTETPALPPKNPSVVTFS